VEALKTSEKKQLRLGAYLDFASPYHSAQFGSKKTKFKKSNPSRWILLIDIQKNPDVGPKNVSHKEVLSWANLRARSKFRRGCPLALAVVHEIADRRCARSRLDCRQNQLLRNTFHLQHLQLVTNLKKPPEMMSLSIFHIHHDGLDFLMRRVKR
jgi:hypothetical protein